MNRKIINRFAVLFIAISGLMGSLLGVSLTAAVFFILGLACFALTTAKKELFLWVIILVALFLLMNNVSFEHTQKAFVMGAEFGTLMIAISFVGLAVNHSYIKPLIQRIFTSNSNKRNNIFSYITGHFSGAILNLSGLLILSSSIHNKEKSLPSSSLVSIHQGFSFAPAWSPYSYFTPIILSTFTSLKWFDLVLVALVFILPMVVISTLTSSKEIQSAPTNSTEIKKNSLKESRALIYTLVFCFTIIGLMSFTNIAPRVLIHCLLPLLALSWAFIEASSIKTFVSNTKNHLLDNIPSLRFEILALSAAGLMSAVIIELPILEYLNSIDLMNNLNGIPWVTSFLVVFLFIVMVALMMLGINPILFVGVIAAGVNIELFSSITGVAVLVGAWGLFPTLSPFAAANLVVGRATGLSGKELSFGVNKKYNFFAFFVCILLIIIIHKLNLSQLVN